MFINQCVRVCLALLTSVIILNDLLRFMLEEEAVRAFALFHEGLESGKITKQGLKNWVVNLQI